MKNNVAQVVLGLPVEGPFDYSVGDEMKEKIAVGERVRVSFGNKVKVGYIAGLIDKSRYSQLKPISALLDEIPIVDSGMLNLVRQFADTYACSTGEAIEAALPSLMRLGKPSEIENLPESIDGKPQ